MHTIRITNAEILTVEICSSRWLFVDLQSAEKFSMFSVRYVTHVAVTVQCEIVCNDHVYSQFT